MTSNVRTASATEGIENANTQGQAETNVKTVDYMSSAGQGQELRPVEVVHQPHPQQAGSNTSGGMLANAAAAVTSTLQSAQEAITKK